MANLFQSIVLAVVIGACIGEPIRFRENPWKNRFFSRQELAPSSTAPPPSKAPYPPAGVTPEIPFELPTEQTTVQPDNTYLPPAPAPTPDNTYGPPDQTYGPPDNTYGPPAVEQSPPAADSPAVDPLANPPAERIIFVPRNVKSLKIRQQPKRFLPLRAARLQLEPVEIVRSQPVIAYSVQYKSF